MEVTEVRVFLVNEDKLKAYVTITFDNCFVVRDLKVIQGKTGLFVAMPSKKRGDGSFKDTAHPLNNETRGMIERAVLAEYRRVVAEDGHSEVQPEQGDELNRDEGWRDEIGGSETEHDDGDEIEMDDRERGATREAESHNVRVADRSIDKPASRTERETGDFEID